MLTTLVPSVHYADLDVGLDLYVDGIGMEVPHRADDLDVVAREGVELFLVPEAEAAAAFRPELGTETDDVEAVHREISA